MRTKILLTLVLSSIVFSLAIPTVAADGDFPYALTTADTPTGFELASTYSESEYVLIQIWIIPSDNTGTTTLTVSNYNSTSIANSAFDLHRITSTGEITVVGADEAIEIDTFNMFYVRNGKYIAILVTGNGTTADVITLLEAQMVLHNAGGGAPGFTLYISFLAIGVVTVLLKKKN